MEWKCALLLMLLLPRPAVALESAAARGAESTDRLVIQSIDVANDRMHELVQPKVNSLYVQTAAIIACAKQQKFYNESTKICQ